MTNLTTPAPTEWQQDSYSQRRGGSMEGFRSSCRRRPKARDSLRFSHIILTKCHKGLEANKGQRDKRGCCCKAFIEGRRKEETKNNSRLHRPTPSSPDLQRGDEEGQIRGFNGRGSEPSPWEPAAARPWAADEDAAAQSQTAAWSFHQAECVGGGSEANTPRALWVSTAQSKALKNTKTKNIAFRIDDTYKVKQLGNNFFVAAAKVVKYSQITWRNNTC